MKYILTFCIIFSGISANGQNLISNSNFSLYTACPTSQTQLNYCNNWFKPTYGSSDYFHMCATSPPPAHVNVPQNFIGYQPSSTNSYVGIYSYYTGSSGNYREYVSTSFSPLQPGATYKVTIIVSLADSCKFASNGLGVYFSTFPVNLNTIAPLPFTPQIDYTSYGLVSDKEHWVTLTKTFVADSAYSSLAIGCFKDDTDITIAATPFYKSLFALASYYYIDSVAVEKIAPPALTRNIAYTTVNSELFPNPFTEYATLTFNNDIRTPYTLAIYDLQGRLVRRMENITTTSIRIDRDNLESGFYCYKLYGANDIVGTGRFVIKD